MTDFGCDCMVFTPTKVGTDWCNPLVRLLDWLADRNASSSKWTKRLHNCRLLAAAHHREIQQRDNDGPGNAIGKNGYPARGSRFGPAILLRIQWVVKDGKSFTLPMATGEVNSSQNVLAWA